MAPGSQGYFLLLHGIWLKRWQKLCFLPQQKNFHVDNFSVQSKTYSREWEFSCHSNRRGLQRRKDPRNWWKWLSFKYHVVQGDKGKVKKEALVYNGQQNRTKRTPEGYDFSLPFWWSAENSGTISLTVTQSGSWYGLYLWFCLDNSQSRRLRDKAGENVFLEE